MAKRRKQAQNAEKKLDNFSQNPRGRHPRMLASEVFGRAKHYRWILEHVWERLRQPLSQAQTEEEVVKAFAENASPYAERFVPGLAPLILRVLHDPKFPKREPKPRRGTLKPRKPKPNQRIIFLADSLAGVGVISPRRSRDICEQERAKERKKTRYKIIRYEYYIECSCGYKGPALDNACCKCGAEIPLSFGVIPGLGFR